LRPPFYVRQLKRDLETWIAQGLVPVESRDAMLASIGALNPARRIDVILSVLGVLLIGAGAMSFVAANWAAMEKPARLVILFGSMWLAYGIASFLMVRGREAFGQAFVLLGVILFGANIWYVAQTYNINSHYPNGTLMWGLGALAAALLVPSRPALSLGILLGTIWSWQETEYFDHPVHYEFLPYWAVATLIAWRLNWRPAVHLAAVALLFWLGMSLDGIAKLFDWGHAEVLTLYILAAQAVWCFSQLAERDQNGLARITGLYALLVFMAGFGLLHNTTLDGHPVSLVWASAGTGLGAAGFIAVVANRRVYSALDILAVLAASAAAMLYVLLVGRYGHQLDVPYAVITLLAILWSLSRGVATDDRAVINLSIVGFGLWFLYTYFELFKGWMDQAVFFMVGGVLLVALGLGLESLRRRLVSRAGAAA